MVCQFDLHVALHPTGRGHEYLRAHQREKPRQFRKAKIVADHHADVAHVRFYRRRQFSASGEFI